MDYRLLADLDTIAVLDSIPKRIRTRLLNHFVKLRSTPDQYSDYHEHDRIGRRIESRSASLPVTRSTTGSIFPTDRLRLWLSSPQTGSNAFSEMTNPFSSAPDETPSSVITVSLALAFYILPTLFICVCVLMRFSGVSRPPYFAYFCAFGSLGAVSISIATANSPLSALGFFIAFLISPFLLVRNYFVLLRSPEDRSIYHQAARWTSLFSSAIIITLLVWMLFDEYLNQMTTPATMRRE